MAAIVTNFFSSKIINLLYANPASMLGLHISNPTTGGLAASEVNTIGYVRQPLTWTTPGNRSMANSNGVTFPLLQPGTITYYGIWKGTDLWLAIPTDAKIIATANASLYIPPLQIAFTIPE